MKVCLVSCGWLEGNERGGSAARVATALGSEHEVVLLWTAPDEEIGGRRLTPEDSGVREIQVEVSRRLEHTVFSCDEHRMAAAVLATLAEIYGEAGPELLEVPDRNALGLMALQARRSGSPLLADTLVAVRLSLTVGVESLHDGTSAEGDNAIIAALEREQLRLADTVVWPGGAGLDQYRDFYGLPLASATVVPDPYPASDPGPATGGSGPLRLLFAAPLTRRAGAIEVAEACLRLPLDDWILTFAGPDSDTAPSGQSVQLTIESMSAGDPRIEFTDSKSGSAAVPGEHDLAIVAPRGGAWFPAAVEAARFGLPLLVTPVGGLPALVEAGAGWTADGVEAADLRAALAPLVDDAATVRAPALRERTQAATRAFTDPHAALLAYAELVAARSGVARQGPRPVPTEPLVTGVIPYFNAPDYIRGAVDSLLGQTHRNLEVLIVNDGSFGPDDDVLGEFDDPRVRVVNQLNSGDTGSRNLGILLARGEFVALLDSDNEMEPEFVARALAVLAREPDLAYVSCWLGFVDRDGKPQPDPAGYAALGNGVVPGNALNWDGDTLSVMPRALFAEHGYRFEPRAGMYSDWELYRRFHRDGRFGTVIPEYLARYRFVPDSVSRGSGETAIRRSIGEARDRLRASATRWEAR